MANTNTTLRRSDYSTYGIKRREDLQYEMFTGTPEALIAAGLIEAHQIPDQAGTGQTTASYLPDGTRVDGSDADQLVPGFRRIYKYGKKFVMERRFDDAEISRRTACGLAVLKKEYETRAEELAWQAMREGIAKCCFGDLRLVWQTKV